MNLRKIELPQPVVTFFQQRGQFIRGLPSYEQIEGRNPLLPEEIKENIRFGIFLHETYPVENKSQENTEKAEEYALDIASTFTRNKPSTLSKLSRTYMLTGYTCPIELKFLIDNEIKSAIYIKKPSVERIFGSYLYNLISGNTPQDCIFNNYSFVERQIPGVHLDDSNKHELSKRPRFIESAVRLATIDEFMEISDLERKAGPANTLTNILVQYDGTLAAFDFDTLLQPYVTFTKSPFLDRLREMNIEVPEKLEKQIQRDEAQRINQVICKHRGCFEGIIELMDKVPYMKSRLEEKGYKSAKRYFKMSLDKIRSKMK